MVLIGGHLVKRLKDEGYWVRGIDLKHNEFRKTDADDFIIGDLRDPKVVADVIFQGVDEIYQLAADMGGAGYIFTGENDANVMHNSALINLNVSYEALKKNAKKIFYSSSACMYPEHNQLDPITLNVLRTALIRQIRTQNTAGKSCLANACISLSSVITAWK